MDELDGFMTLEKAAEMAGYQRASSLRVAVHQGRLRTLKVGKHMHLTTRQWLDEYLETVRRGDYHRGKTRAPKEEQP
jgi:hypothetical protein